MSVRNAGALARLPDPRDVRLTKDEQEWIEGEVRRLCDVTAIEWVGEGVRKPDAIMVASPIFPVKKPGPKRYRMVVDMRQLNAQLDERPFKMEGMATILRCIGRGWWVISLDLEDGYHHVQIDEESRKFLGFRLQNNWYRFRVLPFGLSHSVHTFCKITRAMVVKWRRSAIVAGCYVDDFWVAHPSRERLAQLRDTVIRPDLEAAGFAISNKVDDTPTQTPKILGLIIDTVRCEVQAPADKVAQVQAACEMVMRGTYLPARTLAQVAGKIMAVRRAFAPAKMCTLELYALIDAANRTKGQWTASCA